MYAAESMSYAQTDGTWRKFEVGLDDADLARYVRDWGADPDALPQRVRVTALAVLVEFALFQRVVSARAHDDPWFEERDAWKADLARRLSAIRESVKTYDSTT